MKVKILIILPLILTVGILLGHLMQVLANPGIVTNPGHSVNQLGAGTFAEQGDYFFPGTSKVGIGQVPGSYKLNVLGNIWTTGIDVVGDVRTNNLITYDQTCPTGWSCQIKTWDIAAQSGQFYGNLDVHKQLILGKLDAVNEGGEIYWEGVVGGANQDFIMDRYTNKLRIYLNSNGAELMSIDSSGNLNIGGILIGEQGYLYAIFTRAVGTDNVWKAVKMDKYSSIDWTNINAGGYTDQLTVNIMGYIKPKYSETYTFYVTTDDGAALWIGGAKVVESWQSQGATTYTGTISLIGNKWYPILLEHYQEISTERLKLEWSSSSQPRETISGSSFAMPPVWGYKIY